ncbi:MAG: FliM/FliN family flagellar motor switch protein [Pseudomonadota bacterium]
MSEEVQDELEAADGAGEAGTDEPLLSDDEKEALMEGVSAGVIGTGDDTSKAADVRRYEIRPDAYINYGSFPLLQGICLEMAKRLSTAWSTLLRQPVVVTAEESFAASYATATTKLAAPVVTKCVALAPLPHHAIVVFSNPLLKVLVDTFFGFVVDDPEQQDDVAVRQQFTPGELRVSELASEKMLTVIAPAWERLIAVTPTIMTTEFDPTLGVDVEPKDEVIVCRFLVQAGMQKGHLHFILPMEQIASVADELEGANNARNVIGDPHWQHSISSHLAKTDVLAEVRVGAMRLPLRRVVSLQPGELLPLNDPELAALLVQGERRALGQFGTHESINAFRLSEWLPPSTH